MEIIPRLEKLVCRMNEPDEDDVNLLQAPVGFFSYLVHATMPRNCSMWATRRKLLNHLQCAHNSEA